MQNIQALHSQCFHSFWRSKDGFRSTKIVFPCLRDAQTTINLVRLNQIDLQENSIRHQVDTFQMCPDGVSTCNSVPHRNSIVLIVQNAHKHNISFAHHVFSMFCLLRLPCLPNEHQTSQDASTCSEQFERPEIRLPPASPALPAPITSNNN